MDSGSKGCDLSHYQTVYSFHEIAESCDFVYLKATEGTGFTDPDFADYRVRAASVGLAVGAYHFLHPTLSADAQFEHFVSVYGDLQEGELAPAIDVEATSGWEGSRIYVVERFAELAIQKYGECKIYASPGWWASMFAGLYWLQYPNVCACDLWVAEYGVKAPKVMAPFKTWQIWQNAEFGTVLGAGSRDIDTDVAA